MKLHTMSEVISLAKEIENSSAEVYKNLAEKFEQKKTRSCYSLKKIRRT